MFWRYAANLQESKHHSQKAWWETEDYSYYNHVKMDLWEQTKRIKTILSNALSCQVKFIRCIYVWRIQNIYGRWLRGYYFADLVKIELSASTLIFFKFLYLYFQVVAYANIFECWKLFLILLFLYKKRVWIWIQKLSSA